MVRFDLLLNAVSFLEYGHGVHFVPKSLNLTNPVIVSLVLTGLQNANLILTM